MRLPERSCRRRDKRPASDSPLARGSAWGDAGRAGTGRTLCAAISTSTGLSSGIGCSGGEATPGAASDVGVAAPFRGGAFSLVLDVDPLRALAAITLLRTAWPLMTLRGMGRGYQCG